MHALNSYNDVHVDVAAAQRDTPAAPAGEPTQARSAGTHHAAAHGTGAQSRAVARPPGAAAARLRRAAGADPRAGQVASSSIATTGATITVGAAAKSNSITARSGK